MPNDKKKMSRRTASVIEAFHSVGEDTDVLGSYTGIPMPAKMMIDPADPMGTKYHPLSREQRKELTPVQDADDL